MRSSKVVAVAAKCGYFAQTLPLYRVAEAELEVETMLGEDEFWVRVRVDKTITSQVQVDRRALGKFAARLAKLAARRRC